MKLTALSIITGATQVLDSPAAVCLSPAVRLKLKMQWFGRHWTRVIGWCCARRPAGGTACVWAPPPDPDAFCCCILMNRKLQTGDRHRFTLKSIEFKWTEDIIMTVTYCTLLLWSSSGAGGSSAPPTGTGDLLQTVGHVLYLHTRCFYSEQFTLHSFMHSLRINPWTLHAFKNQRHIFANK